ncbi:hypothetical protein ACW9HW_30195, partial [Pseudomonas sp. SDO5532_S415]
TPVVATGAPFDEVASRIDQASEPIRSLPPDASAEARQVLIAASIHPDALFQDRLGRPFAWAWIGGDGSFGWAANGS